MLYSKIIKLNEIIAKLKENNNNILQTENLSFSDFDCSTKLDIAKEYLKNILLCNNTDGTSEKIMLPAIDIISEMKNKGISKRTLEKAKMELGVASAFSTNVTLSLICFL